MIFNQKLKFNINSLPFVIANLIIPEGIGGGHSLEIDRSSYISLTNGIKYIINSLLSVIVCGSQGIGGGLCPR